MAKRRSVGLLAPVFLLFLASGPANAQPSASAVGSEVTSDFKYLVNNTLLDAEDVVTSPLYVASSNSALRSPRFYLVLAGAGALFGGSFALDQTMRSHLGGMNSSSADLCRTSATARSALPRRCCTATAFGSMMIGQENTRLPLARGPE